MLTEPLCAGRRCVVVGSAPDLVLPDAMSHDVVVAANGGAAIARDAGRVVHVFVTTSHLFRDGASEQEMTTRSMLRGLCVMTTWVDEKNGPWTGPQIGESGMSPGWLRRVTPEARSLIVSAACGVDLWVSTGIFAACLAIASDAKEVILCGISMSRGHLGMPNDHSPRYHVFEDTACLTALYQHRTLSTTCPGGVEGLIS